MENSVREELDTSFSKQINSMAEAKSQINSRRGIKRIDKFKITSDAKVYETIDSITPRSTKNKMLSLFYCKKNRKLHREHWSSI